MKSLKGIKCKGLVVSLIFLISIMNSTLYAKSSETAFLFPAKVNTSTGESYGYIDAEGKWIIEPIYDYAYPFSEGLGVMQKGDLFGIVDEQGNTVLKPRYESITPFKEARAIYTDTKGMGVLNQKGKVVTKKQYAFIEDYSEGLAVMAEAQKDASYLYGYIDQEGKQIIPPTYSQAEPFKEGRALVKVSDKEYRIIDKQNKVITVLNYPIIYGYSEDAMVFSDKIGGKVGYVDTAGKVIVPAIYESGEAFKEGVAIVSIAPYYRGEQGLINKEGTYIYSPIYNDILYLGEGRVALGKALDKDNPSKGSMYAIADTKGNILTDFMYSGVNEYKNGKASAFDAKTTYFIDEKGQKINSLPTVIGAGTLAQQGEVIVADIDYQTYYLTPDGKVIYKPNDVIPLNEVYSVKEEKHKPNINYLAYYPEIEGMKDEAKQKQVNEALKALSFDAAITGEQLLDYTYYENFDVQFYNKDLLVLKMLASTYYFGAAHPLPTMNTPVINLVTGDIYKLEDLFKQNTDWQAELNSILQEQAKTEPMQDELFADATVAISADQPFYVDQEALYIYYAPYDIGPYSSGFITFRIPYSEIENSINKTGAFWKAYH